MDTNILKLYLRSDGYDALLAELIKTAWKFLPDDRQLFLFLPASGLSGSKASSCHETQLKHLRNVISLASRAVSVSCYGPSDVCEAFRPAENTTLD